MIAGTDGSGGIEDFVHDKWDCLKMLLRSPNAWGVKSLSVANYSSKSCFVVSVRFNLSLSESRQAAVATTECTGRRSDGERLRDAVPIPCDARRQQIPRCRSRQIVAVPGKFTITIAITSPLPTRPNSKVRLALCKQSVRLRSRRLQVRILLGMLCWVRTYVEFVDRLWRCFPNVSCF